MKTNNLNEEELVLLRYDCQRKKWFLVDTKGKFDRWLLERKGDIQ